MCFLSFCWYKYKQENVYARAFHSFWFVIENYAPRHGVMKENKKKKEMKILNSNSFVFAFDDVVIARNTLSWKMMLYDVKNHFSSFSSFCPCQHKTFTSKVLQSTDSFTRQFQMISYTSFTHILRSEIILIVQNVCNTEKCQNKNQQIAWSAKKDGISHQNALAMMWWVTRWNFFHRLKLKLKQLVNEKDAAEWRRTFLWSSKSWAL